MCGISGILFNGIDTGINKKNLQLMTQCLRHRGPDNISYYINNQLGLGHNRLSILDLSPNGNQPMVSFSGRYVISYNGEIYNHLQLRKKVRELYKFNKWSGSSDTSTLINLFELWDINTLLQNLKGMFALAVWDNKLHKLYLARDRFGEKPIYYSFINSQFYFSSELKSFNKIINFDKKISKKAINIYSRTNYIPSPYSIYENVYKLEPGSYLEILPGFNKIDEIKKDQNINSKYLKKVKWWNPQKKDLYYQNYRKLNYTDKIKKLDHILEESVKSQMLSDVKIGSFLSGGIDSGLISFYMQKNSIEPIETFTVGMTRASYDESITARSISKHLNTNHNEYILSENDIIKYLPEMYNIYDEPFADSSQIPTYIISKFASKKIKVALTGDGGDELFAGYVRHKWSKKIYKLINLIPPNLKIFFSKFLLGLNHDNSRKIEIFLNFFLKSHKKLVQMDKKLNKLGSLIRSEKNISEYYLNLISIWPYSNSSKFNQNEFILTKKNDYFDPEILLMLDIENYLHDDILCKVDRASMKSSLETRIPFLDLDVFRISQSFKFDEKIINGIGKYPLRKLAENNLTKEISNLPKKGFGVPLNDLMRNELKEWVEDTINTPISEKELINFDELKKNWSEHLEGKNYGEYIWNSIILLNWIQNKNGNT